MKRDNKNLIIIFIVIVAVLGFSAVKNYRLSRDMDQVGTDVKIGSGKPVMLQLGSHGCGPCRQMLPILQELAEEYTDTVGVKYIDIYADVQSARKYSVEAMPTQVFLDGQGNELFRHVGYYTFNEIVEKWKELGIDLGDS